MVDSNYIRSVLHYEENTGVFTWLIKTNSHGGGRYIGDEAGCLAPNGYILIGISGKIYRAHRLAWLWMTGEWPSSQIDHINMIKSDNRWSNLRIATNGQNVSNRRTRKDSRSGVKGVVWHNQAKKWAARITKDGKYRHLGLFDTIDDAAIAYSSAADSLHGEYARSK
jgi:hypothetical protein